MDDKSTSIVSQSAATNYYIQNENEEHGIDLRSYLLTVLNRRWMILAITALVVLGVAIYSFLQTPVYRSRVVLEIDVPGAYAFQADPATQPYFWRDRQSFMNTQYTTLQGRNLAKIVAEKLDLTIAQLRPDPSRDNKRAVDRASKEAEIDLVATRLLQMITVQPVRDTNLCEITFTTPSPHLSMKLANAWAEQYLELHMNSIRQYTQKAGELLSEQVGHLQKEIAEKEQRLYDYSIEKNIIKPGKSESISSMALTDLNGALLNATRERIMAQVRYSALSTSSKTAIPEVISHPSVQKTIAEYSSLERLYENQSKIYKPNYPEMVRLRQQLDQMRNELEQQSQKAYEEVLATARAERDRAYGQERAFKQQMEKAQVTSVESGRKELSYDQIAMEIENKKLLLTSLLQKYNEIDVSAQIQGRKAASTTRIIEYPELPKTVFSPNIQKNLLFALMAGILGGIALAIGLEFFNRTIRSPEDVETFLNIPFLGIVPQYSFNDDNGHKNGSRALVKKETPEILLDVYAKDLLTTNDPECPAAEAIKTVRTSLLLAFPSAPPKSILVTSSRAGEGKTFIACNLAIALAQLDKRVVLIDADLRNPRIHRIWDAHNNTGLSIYLTSEIPVDSVLRPSSVNRLAFISSGPKTPRPAELLASARFQAMLQQLEKDFDFVILDSPPILPVADSVILASSAQSVVMVVYGGSTPRDVVRMAKKKLSASNAVIIGAIVNGLDFSDPYYYYKYYSNYSYSYYGKDEASSDQAQ